MTESVQGLSQSQETGSQPVTPQSSVPTQVASTEAERTFRQSEVNDIVKKAKFGAVEDFKRMQSTQPQYVQEKHQDFSSQSPAGRPEYQLPEERIRQIVNDATKEQLQTMRQEAFQQTQNEAAKKTVQNFWNKVLPGREKFQDFDTVVGDIDFQRFPNVVQLLGDHVENSAEVLYELGKDRSKMATLEYLAERSPNDALKAAQRLATSLKDNEAAKNTRLPNEPLSQMRPSNAGTDQGALSVSDYRKKYKV